MGALPSTSKRAVERGGLAGDQLRAQVGQVAAILVLPDQQGVEARLPALLVGLGDALLPQRVEIDAAFVADVEGAARKAIHGQSLNLWREAYC